MSSSYFSINIFLSLPLYLSWSICPTFCLLVYYSSLSLLLQFISFSQFVSFSLIQLALLFNFVSYLSSFLTLSGPSCPSFCLFSCFFFSTLIRSVCLSVLISFSLPVLCLLSFYLTLSVSLCRQFVVCLFSHLLFLSISAPLFLCLTISTIVYFSFLLFPFSFHLYSEYLPFF